MKTEKQKIIILSVALVGIVAAIWWMNKNPAAAAGTAKPATA